MFLITLVPPGGCLRFYPLVPQEGQNTELSPLQIMLEKSSFPETFFPWASLNLNKVKIKFLTKVKSDVHHPRRKKQTKITLDDL